MMGYKNGWGSASQFQGSRVSRPERTASQSESTPQSPTPRVYTFNHDSNLGKQEN